MNSNIVLANARIIDGTGAPWFRGSVAVGDGTIQEVTRRRERPPSAEAVIDVDEDIVCPGFIDTHSKSDVEIFADPTVKPKIRQGITTEIIGHDGYSIAPLNRCCSKEKWKSVLGAFAKGASAEEWSWGTLGEFLSELDRNGVSPNVGTLVGHGTVRYNVLGMEDTQPSRAELDRMADLVSESLEQGALGLSTGLVYPPQMYSDTDELRALAQRLRPYGRPLAAHIRSQGRYIWDAIDELYDIGVSERVPIYHSHIQLSGEIQQRKADRALHLIETARERGADVAANQHPYTAGSTNLSALLPPWILSNPTEEIKERLLEPEVRTRIRRAIENWEIDGWENLGGLTGWENVIIANVNTPENQSVEGCSLEEIARKRGDHPVDVLCDLLVDEDFEVDILLHKLAEEDIRTLLVNERISVCTDGFFGENPHPRTYGTYPKVLGEIVRDQNLLTVAEAIRKMTSLPARMYGLQKRGLVRPGMSADLVVFNPLNVGSSATYEQPTQLPRGIRHVIVNGEFVVRNGEITGATPGEVLTA